MKPQLKIPSKGDPYYNTISTGGYNPCILGNPDRRVQGLNVLPNCCGYATGRWNSIYHEALGGEGCQYLGNTNAANYIKLAQRQGLKISPVPTLGGCMVWKGGATAEGHVAIVEMMCEKEIVTSESEYYGKPFTTVKRTNEDGNWRTGCKWMTQSYKFIGCIINPGTEDDMTKAETEALIRELVPQIIKQLEEEKAKEPADDWAKNAINMAIARNIMIGYPDGFHAQSYIRREEVAQVVANLTAKE